MNYSVFYYEVMNQHGKACELGEAALTEALEKIDDVDEETFRDAKSIIELLKENLSLWKEEEGDNAVEDLWTPANCNLMKFWSRKAIAYIIKESVTIMTIYPLL